MISTSEKLKDAARALLEDGEGLREAERHFHLALLNAAIDLYGSKGAAANVLGVHRNTISRLSLHRQRAVQRVKVAR